MIRQALLAVCFACAAAAQVPLAEFRSMATPFGQLTVLPQGRFQEALTLNGRTIPGLSNRRVTIRGAYQIPDGQSVWVIVTTAYGGNMCPETTAILMLSAAGIATTQPFGECLGLIQAVRIGDGFAEVDLKSAEVMISHVTYRFDGTRLTENAVPAEPGATPAGPGADVTRWIGKHPAMIFDDAGERARFLQIMAPADLEELRKRLGPAGPAARHDGWVFGAGCQAHQCNAERAFWAVRIADGKVVAGTQSVGGQTRLYGGSLTDMPPVARVFVNSPWSR